jgi:hypothetical protein
LIQLGGKRCSAGLLARPKCLWTAGKAVPLRREGKRRW